MTCAGQEGREGESSSGNGGVQRAHCLCLPFLSSHAASRQPKCRSLHQSAGLRTDQTKLSGSSCSGSAGHLRAGTGRRERGCARKGTDACSVPDAQSAPRQRGLAPRRALLRTGGDLDHLALAPDVLGRALLRDGVRHVVAPADLQPAPHQRVELGGGVALPIAHPVDLARCLEPLALPLSRCAQLLGGELGALRCERRRLRRRRAELLERLALRDRCRRLRHSAAQQSVCPQVARGQG